MLVAMGVLGLVFEVYWLFTGGLQHLGFTGVLLAGMGALANFSLIGAGLRVDRANIPLPQQPRDDRPQTWDEVRAMTGQASSDAGPATASAPGCDGEPH